MAFFTPFVWVRLSDIKVDERSQELFPYGQCKNHKGAAMNNMLGYNMSYATLQIFI